MTTMLDAPVLTLQEACRVLELDVPAGSDLGDVLRAEYARLEQALRAPLSEIRTPALGKLRARHAIDRRLIESVLAGHGLDLHAGGEA